MNHPAALVSYLFNGYLDDIYATLVVRLHHTELFERHELWRYAADFKSATGKQLGFKLIHRGESAANWNISTQISRSKRKLFSFDTFMNICCEKLLMLSAKDITPALLFDTCR